MTDLKKLYKMVEKKRDEIWDKERGPGPYDKLNPAEDIFKFGFNACLYGLWPHVIEYESRLTGHKKNLDGLIEKNEKLEKQDKVMRDALGKISKHGCGCNPCHCWTSVQALQIRIESNMDEAKKALEQCSQEETLNG